jgi:two-component system cell cycle sensor histidine kinase/response regulator CckA
MFSHYIDALKSEETFLLARVRDYASSADFTLYANSDEDKWRTSLRKPSRALIEYLEEHDAGEPIHVDGQYRDNSTITFGIDIVQEHRDRGEPLDGLVRFIKYVRQAFVDLVFKTSLAAEIEKRTLAVTHRFFDKVELNFINEWQQQEQKNQSVDVGGANGHPTDEKNRYRAIFNSLAEPAFVLDRQMGLVEGNAALEQFLGTPMETIKGRHCSQIFNCALCDECPLEEAIVRQQANAGIETTMVVNGQKKHVSIGVSFLDGGHAGSVAILHDITKSRQAEENLRLLSQITEQVADPLIVTDLDFKITYVNQVFRDLYGYDPEELIGQTPAVLNAESNAPEIQEEIFKKVSQGGIWRGEALNRKKDETLFPCELMIFPVQDERGKILAFAGSQRDITERKRTSEELQKMEKLESVGVLAGGIAHDLNNLLTMIIGNISLAKMEDEPEVKDRFLAEAETATIRVKDLTQQLLTFSKGGQPVKKLAHIGDLLEEFSAFSLSGSNVSCEYALAEQPWHVEIDEGQISQVINNLIINAQQAMPHGGTVNIATENIEVGRGSRLPLNAGPYVKISIKDEGIGISKKDQLRIFDPFFSTKQNGSGLGLATSYAIIQKHHGYFTVESQVGAGTTFFVYLPAIKVETAIRREGRETEPIRGEGKILVMDDEKHLRDLTAEMLSILGYKVVTSIEGSEAIKIYQTAKESGSPFDAVILDLTIPGGMGGGEAVQHLGKITRDVKAIVSSGYSNDPILANFKDYGFSGRIAKPFRIRELSEVLHQVITSSATSKRSATAA